MQRLLMAAVRETVEAATVIPIQVQRGGGWAGCALQARRSMKQGRCFCGTLGGIDRTAVSTGVGARAGARISRSGLVHIPPHVVHRVRRDTNQGRSHGPLAVCVVHSVDEVIPATRRWG